jgi:hypothetical protein
MAHDGWEFVDLCTPHYHGATYLIFRSQAEDRPPQQQETSIKEVNRGYPGPPGLADLQESRPPATITANLKNRKETP